MTHWLQAQDTSLNRAGFVQWYLCDGHESDLVGEVVCLNNELGTYCAELLMGKGLRYFTDVEDAKAYLWSFYILEKASCN